MLPSLQHLHHLFPWTRRHFGHNSYIMFPSILRYRLTEWNNLMERKSILIPLAVVLILLSCFVGGQYFFAHSNSAMIDNSWYFSIHQTNYTDQNPPPQALLVVRLTEEDFAKHPVLHDLFEQRQLVLITDDPFLIMQISGPHISHAEAEELIAAYDLGYIDWNGSYYSLTQIFT